MPRLHGIKSQLMRHFCHLLNVRANTARYTHGCAPLDSLHDRLDVTFYYVVPQGDNVRCPARLP